MLDTRELGRRPGAMRKVSRSVPAPEGLAIDGVVGVPAGSPLELDLRLESVVEGVLVTGTARALAEGECVRCLEPVELALDVEFQELWIYPEDADERRAAAGEADDEDEELRIEDDLIDLGPVVRDAVVLDLPLQPVDVDDCPGLCPECGARLADDPGHHHDEAVDPRWAALQGLTVAPDTAGAGDDNTDGADGADENQEK